MPARVRNRSETTYLVVHSRTPRLQAGTLVRMENRGEIVFLHAPIIDRGGITASREAAILVRIRYRRKAPIIRKLLQLYSQANELATITGVPEEEIKNAVTQALRRILAEAEARP